MVGLLARFSALPLMVTMVVAILTAKREQIETVFDLIGFEETTYLVVFLWIAIAGAGKASVDHVLWRALNKSRAGTGSTGPSA